MPSAVQDQDQDQSMMDAIPQDQEQQLPPVPAQNAAGARRHDHPRSELSSEDHPEEPPHDGQQRADGALWLRELLTQHHEQEQHPDDRRGPQQPCVR